MPGWVEMRNIIIFYQSSMLFVLVLFENIKILDEFPEQKFQILKNCSPAELLSHQQYMEAMEALR